jgi:hypothetical protein
MGAKSRGNWNLGLCLKECAVRSKKKCGKCVKFSEYEPVKAEEKR